MAFNPASDVTTVRLVVLLTISGVKLLDVTEVITPLFTTGLVHPAPVESVGK